MYIAKTALAKWAANDLTTFIDANGKTTYRFFFEGTTCTNMGQTFPSALLCTLEMVGERYRITDVSVEIDHDNPAVKTMCTFRLGSASVETVNAESRELLEGRWLDECLEFEGKVNPAGCFCGLAKLKHKWALALRTITYALENEVTS